MTPEEMQKVSEELNGEVERIKSEYQKASGILKKIQEFSDSFDQLKPLIESSKDDVVANSEQIKALKSDIEASQKQSWDLVENITVNLEKVKGNIVSMQEAYDQFSELKGKVSGRGDEIEGLVNSSRGLQKDIEKTKVDAQQTLDSIKAVLVDVQTKTQEMQAAYESFLQIKSKIEDPSSGLKAIFDLVQGLRGKSEIVYKDIQNYKEEATKLVAGIKKNSEDAESLKTKVSENLAFTEEKKRQVEDVTGLIIDATFSETFERRKSEIEKNVPTWRKIFFWSIVFLGIAVLFIQTPWSGIHPNNIFEAFIYRIVLTSPIWSLVIFSAFQYSKERDLVEKYAFKATSAAAIRNHIEFLLKSFSDVDDKKQSILKFSKSTFSMIYSEPYKSSEDFKKDIENLRKDLDKLQLQDKARGGINIREITESIKELKSLLPNESIFEKVLDWFTKNK